VDLEVREGQLVAVVGASGSGKSTLLNLLAGLDTPTAGRILVEGSPLDELDRRQLARHRADRVGMVFQSFHLLPHFTALANVELALMVAGEPPSQRRKKATRTLERFGLGDRLHHRPSDLSGGEQQRVALARALVKHPRILLADEPTGNLDEEATGHIAATLKELRSEGLTIVLVTHDLRLAAELADATLRLRYGRMVEQAEEAAP
jgi:putative ABC transport system ATP-binding protein